ncbi:hypothetical protein AB0A74_09010 [Saccharothrix sp. NPDC042600]|uniref:hypothetical protein n=1 Tax=Saccharothrix TaxID=2071 RepID=UPI0033C1E1C2|nr:hypothetical protein GCM10017745_13130 [Saccharothrix mutabilis subsp. capreolus]
MDELRAAAFGDRPGADVWWALAGTPRERWLAAVALGGRGHYAAAATALGGLLRSGDHLIVSLAASTLASHRRQLGGHTAARPLDALALTAAAHAAAAAAPPAAGATTAPPAAAPTTAPTTAPPAGATATGPATTATDPDGVDPAGARADALLGLAADALGAGRTDEARRLHARVTPHSWRTRVRHGWVAAEIELGSGHAQRAVGPAEAALRHAEAAGATRHVLKSKLVLGTALVVWGTPESVDRGVRLLQCDLNHTNHHGLSSLIWPTALVLLTSPAVRNSAETAELRETAANALSCVLRRADPISRRIAASSPWVPASLLRSGEPPNADAETNFLTD